ncbi:TPA: aminotransferase class I/II-fold pyridoxal phosphate-dependent enzyme, partial [Candidatus Micrarchaeota archaeon]|nr:aminotransferase class I/II-fold pyridoxal phosphate-dependent enzyme [Candidatus Micrarchaeota archaeon]
MKFRKCLKDIEPYAWQTSSSEIAAKYGLDENDIIRFDQNTLPSSGNGMKLPEVNDYPDASYKRLLSAIAEYAGVKETQVAAGAGADEIIDNIAKLFIEPCDKVVISTPTYSMYRIRTEISGGIPVEVQRDASFRVDVSQLIEIANRQDVKIIFICNPNNP